MATIKTSVNLSPASVEALKEIAARTGTSMADVLRRAISTEKYLRDEDAKGNKILIADKDNNIKQIILQR